MKRVFLRFLEVAAVVTAVGLSGCGNSGAPSVAALSGTPASGGGVAPGGAAPGGSGATPGGSAPAPTAPAPELALAKSCSSVEGATLRPKPSAVPAACVAQSWLAGGSELCQGRHVYRDYVYDDFGADTGAPSKSAGDTSYPAGAGNTADLVNLQLWTEGGRLRVRSELNALFEAASTVLALAIDTDGKAATGGGAWCDLGVTSSGWEVLQAFRQGDVDSNVIEGSLPMPAGSRWRVQAVVAQADGTVMNVAYRGIDEGANCARFAFNVSSGCYFEDRQAVALADGDISAFGATVNVADLTSGATAAPPALTPGLHSRVYTSAYTLPPGEGRGRVPGRGNGGNAPVLNQFFDLLGKYQPYGVYLPATAKPPYHLQMVFHGSGETHVNLIGQPGFQQALGERFGRLLVAPFARGPDGYGSDISERDVLDVMADVEKTYPIDAERVLASGYSQGGYLTYRMTALYPQRFAGFVSWSGFTGEYTNGLGVPASVTAGAVGNMRDFVGNLRHVPGAMIYAGADNAVTLTNSRDLQQAFAATDDVYRWYLHPAADHNTFQILDMWDKEVTYSEELKRVVNPPRITFRHDPTLGNAEYGIRHDRAYWVSGIVNRTVGADHLAQVYGDLDLTNRSCSGSAPTTAIGNGMGTTPLPWVSEERNVTGSTPFAADNLLEGTLTNIAALTIDAAATCNAGKPLRYAITTDGAAEIRLSDGRRIALPAAGTHRGAL